MAGKYATLHADGQPTSALQSTGVETWNAVGGIGYEYEPATGLLLLAATNMVAEDTYHERARDRDARFARLATQVAVDRPDLILPLVNHIRGTLNMRSSAIALAVHAIVAWKVNPWKAGLIDSYPPIRAVVSAACQRPDEPGEFIAAWRYITGKRTLPGGVQRGVADAVTRLYDERAAIKWDGKGKPWRLGDVIEVVHPTPLAGWQGDLFKWLLDRRRHDAAVPESLPVIRAYERLTAMDHGAQRAFLLQHPEELRTAGVTWEHLSGLGPMDQAAWEAVIPSMGYMALLRNLRNFDKAGVTDKVASGVIDRLTDPEQVARSRQLPFRFLAASRETGPRWAYPLEKAIGLSMGNVPALSGRTLVIVDLSPSMNAGISGRSTVMRSDVASLAAAVLAGRCEAADVYTFSRLTVHVHTLPKHLGVMANAKAIADTATQAHGGSGGTYLAHACRASYRDGYHDRLIVLTDGQSHDGPVPEGIKVPTWIVDLAGYQAAPAYAGKRNRYVIPGWTDHLFDLIDAVEQGQRTRDMADILATNG